MTDQTGAAEVEALAQSVICLECGTQQVPRHDGLCHIMRCEGRPTPTPDWLAADRAAAEARGAERVVAVRDEKFGNLRWMDGHQQGLKDGAERVLAAVEDAAAEMNPARVEVRTLLDAARAAAVTTSSAKTLDLATRPVERESQHTGGGS